MAWDRRWSPGVELRGRRLHGLQPDARHRSAPQHVGGEASRPACCPRTGPCWIVGAIAFATAPCVALHVQLGLQTLYFGFPVLLLVAEAVKIIHGDRRSPGFASACSSRWPSSARPISRSSVRSPSCVLIVSARRDLPHLATVGPLLRRPRVRSVSPVAVGRAALELRSS